MCNEMASIYCGSFLGKSGALDDKKRSMKFVWPWFSLEDKSQVLCCVWTRLLPYECPCYRGDLHLLSSGATSKQLPCGVGLIMFHLLSFRRYIVFICLYFW